MYAAPIIVVVLIKQGLARYVVGGLVQFDAIFIVVDQGQILVVVITVAGGSEPRVLEGVTHGLIFQDLELSIRQHRGWLASGNGLVFCLIEPVDILKTVNFNGGVLIGFVPSELLLLR